MSTRTITIVCRDGNDFDVFDGEDYANRLCWDEMLGAVAELTHPKIGSGRYLRTPEQHDKYREWLDGMAARRAAEDAQSLEEPTS